MNNKISEIWEEYNGNWKMLYELFENLPEKKLVWSISKDNRTLKQMLAPFQRHNPKFVGLSGIV